MPKCPLCPAEVQNIRQHLRVVHKVLNVQERDILIKFARSRVKLENLECPLCQKAPDQRPQRHNCKLSLKVKKKKSFITIPRD